MLKNRRTVLIVEDEEIIRTTLREFLTGEGYETESAGSVAQATTLARGRDFQVAICDVQLPDGDGIALLRRLQQMNPHLFVLIITAYATVENAVEAFKAGAYDYLVKPVIFDDLLHKLDRLFSYRDVLFENQMLRRELSRHTNLEELVGSSQALIAAQETVRKVAATACNVLLEGESGTGKELFARAIHRAGPKRREKFLAVNCGTSPPELLESQLFGHVQGAFSRGRKRSTREFSYTPARGRSFSMKSRSSRFGTQAQSCCGRSSTRKSSRSAPRSRSASIRGSSPRRPAT